ncbi:MAG: Lipopolysaccharide core heptosyltransferase RfaQ, partial [Candidatus Anoxychlamydiales bacterium]|nr:Lipopolysaccharide core heptosyltransferase RfaQ [Candidatus Anoxychlamydiales bacterium]
MKNPFKTKPLKHKYHVKNIFLLTFLKTVDFVSWIYFKIFKNKKKFDQNLLKNPKKILLSNIAHLGDVVISTSVLSLLKKKYPNVKIGFICSSSSKQILENNPNIDQIYIVDHWYLNRSKISFLKKLISYYKTRKIAQEQIKKDNYDIAIDLYYFFPNSIYLINSTSIPIRIGYSSGGFKNFLTHTKPWVEQNKHVSFYLLDLLKTLSISISSYPIVKFELPSCKKENESEPKLPDIIKNLPDDFFLFHIGAGSDEKMWTLSKWRELTQKIDKDKKMKIIFTGKGTRESNLINEITQNQSNLYNFSDKLDLSSLIEVIKKAKLVVCVDSVVLHLATALNVPTIVLCSNTNNHHHWVMKRENIIPITKNLSPNLNYKK